MARPENNDSRRRIEQAAFRLFKEEGYTKTSYSAIADACDMTKALVQYYFKKKEDLAIDLMRATLDECIDDLGYRGVESSEAERFRELLQIGTEYFGRLLASDGYVSFLADILASRKLTETVLAFNAEWAYTYLGRGDQTLDQDASDVVIMSMGGFYELLYHVLEEGRSMDIRPLLRRVVGDFMVSLGYTKAQVAKTLTD